MTRDSLQVLRDVFGVDEEVAVEILMLTEWVDQQVAIERFGYPKDNLIPPPMADRLADKDYLEKLVEAARDQEPQLVDVLRNFGNNDAD